MPDFYNLRSRRRNGTLFKDGPFLFRNTPAREFDARRPEIKQTLKITEIFYSLQGEGNASGYPFLFIRFSGCNLRCGYCDTAYSFDQGKEISIEEVLGQIRSFLPVKRILLTGGEPLLQKEGLITLSQELLKQDKEVFLETNGSQEISGLPESIIRIVDIKTPGSGFGNSFLLSNLNHLTSRDEIKFVISSELDLDFAEDFIQRHRLPQRCTVHFSPVIQSISPQTVAKRILEQNLEVRLTLQLHKILEIQ